MKILTNNIVNVIKKYKMLVIYFVFAITMGLMYFYDFKEKNLEFLNTNVNTARKIYIMYLLFFVVFSVLLYVLLIICKKISKVHIRFLILDLFIGTICLFAVPILSGSDELAHFCRIYEISLGNFATPVYEEIGTYGTDMPVSLQNFHDEWKGSIKYINLKDAINFKLNADETKFYGAYYSSAVVYSPIQYLPQIIGVFIGRILNLSVYWVAILGRITGFAFWLFVVTYAIKRLPVKKEIISLLLLTPVAVSSTIVLTGDLMINAFVLLFVSIIFDICYNKLKVSRKDWTILVISSIIIALSKIVYVPLLLLLFLIPKASFENTKKSIILRILIVLASVILALAWLKIANRCFELSYSAGSEQIKFILKNPIKYGIIFIRSIYDGFIQYFMSFTGYGTYNGHVSIYSFISYIFTTGIIVGLLNNNEKITFNIKQKIGVIFILLMVIVLMFTALYVQFTAATVKVGASTINGVQGRYFIPIVMALVLILDKKLINIDTKYIEYAFMLLQVPIMLNIIISFIV